MRGRRWVLAVVAIVAFGVAASLTTSLMWRSSVHARERQTFETSAANVSGTLETLLRRDTDFVKSVRAVLTLQPNLSATGFDRWLARLGAQRGEPAGYGALIFRSVPAGQLAAFQAKRNADPAFRALVGHHVESIAPAGRPRYCLLTAGSANLLYDPEIAALLQRDWCDSTSLIAGYQYNSATRAGFTQAITDNGDYGVYSIVLSNVSSLLIEVAAYRQGVPLASVAERRAAVLGWVLGSFDVNTLMSAALGGAHHIGVTLYHANPGQGPEFIGGVGAGAHTFAHQETIQTDGTWIVKVTGAAVLSGPSANVQALVMLLAGIFASLLLAALVLVLARAR